MSSDLSTTSKRRSPNGAPNGSAHANGVAAGVRVVATELYFLPVQTRVPLKFGGETLTSVTCARAKVTVADAAGRTAEGWGETPLSVQWLWPSETPYEDRHTALRDFCTRLAERLPGSVDAGHPLEIGHTFQERVMAAELERRNASRSAAGPMPLLAALACCSPLDIATYDAYAKLLKVPVFETLGERFLTHDLAHYLEADDDLAAGFRGRYPSDYLVGPPAETPIETLDAWHLVGGLDPIDAADLAGDEPDDGHPVLLGDWIERDGLKCLKVKLRGVDEAWDYERLVRVGELAIERGVEDLTADFNCTVTSPEYVVRVLDRLAAEHPAIHDRVLYIEQPFPYELEENRIDVREVSRRKPLLMDESAHNWQLVRLGRSLGWTGVALKTCKTLTGALLMLCWAKAHGMRVMVQDLTNPMLAQIPHVLLAAHAGTMRGVETNAMQFYPQASDAEARVHPGLYQRRNGRVDLSTLRGPGFGYRVDEINRRLPEPAAVFSV